jgi:Mg-chelatase subunit ChlD
MAASNMAASKRWIPYKLFVTAIMAIIILPCMLFCSTPDVRAEEALTGEKLAIILVIDTSGSMQNTDPQMLRETASRIFIDLLSPEDFLGVITFDHDARVVFPLERIESTSRKEQIKEKLSAELQPRGYTDYLEALEAARGQFQQFQAAGTGNARQLAVLLTDGEPSPDPALTQNNPAFMGSYMDSLWKLVEDYALSGIPIYTVAFSDEINPELTQKISLDTKGDSYLLEEPGELVVSFFKLLGHLKNRRSLVNRTFHLQEGSPQAFEFQVEDYIRQVNLVAVNLAAGKCELSIVPPGSRPGEIERITVNNHENYSMAVLSDPGDTHTGKWQAVFSGSGEVNVLGDMDLFIKGWLEEPVPLSQHPLNEPLQLKVKVTGDDFLQDIPLKVEIQLEKSGADPVFIPLQEGKGGYYTGVYDKVDETGTYELTLRLLFDDQVISTDPFKFYVKLLPTLSTDFWPAEDIRLGEEVVITGALNARGKRLEEGRELIVDNFSLVINYEDGTRETVPLNDQGKQEQGDIKRADGIWSGRHTFKKEGIATAALLAAGKYMGSEFTVEKGLDPFAVYAPGKVHINASRLEYSSLPGRSISLTLEVNNESSFQETLFVDQRQDPVGGLSSRGITLEPGQKTSFNLDLNLFQDLQPRIYPLRLAFVAENSSTAVEPQILEMELEIITPGIALARILSSSFRPLLYGVGVALITLLIFLILGMLLYCLFVCPGKKIQGALLYYKAGEENDEVLPQKIILGKYKKDAVRISFNPENKKADYHIQDSEFDYDIIIKRVSGKDALPFLQGWNTLLKKQPPFNTIVCCSEPGIMEFSGKIYTSKELFHSETFASGGYIFQYNSPYEKKTQQQKNYGTNVLEGKI